MNKGGDMLEDKFYGYLSMRSHFKDDEMWVKAAHDLAEIKFKADKDKIKAALGGLFIAIQMADKADWQKHFDITATEMLKALEVEE